jgi:hypothetical protein
MDQGTVCRHLWEAYRKLISLKGPERQSILLGAQNEFY